MAISARYWRLEAMDTSWVTSYGSYHWNLYEAYLYASADASGSRISVSSATESTKYSALYPGANVQDGNTATFWSTAWNQASPQWVAFDCGAAVAVGSFAIDTSCNTSGMFGPKKIALRYSSDGTNWTTLAIVDVANAFVQHTIRTFTDLQIAWKPLIYGGKRPAQFGGLLMRN